MLEGSRLGGVLPYGEEREKGAQKQNDVPDPSKPFMQCVT
jgi:hypothetical protein